jgi:hypothetical protein
VRGHGVPEPLVDYPGNPVGGPVAATSTVTTSEEDVGRRVALAFQTGDPERPVILGFIRHPEAISHHDSDDAKRVEVAPATESEGAPGPETAHGTVVRAALDGDRLELTAGREIVLRCGKASITLTRAGKVLIRGAYLLNRSSGVNRIKGGSVQIN